MMQRRLHSPNFLSVYGERLLSLEQNIIRHRAFQMILLLYQAERLRRECLSCIQTTDDLHASLTKGAKPIRIPRGTKRSNEKALDILVADGVFSKDEAVEIGELIDVRNLVAHEVENLNVDVSNSSIARDLRRFGKVHTYDYKVLERLEYFRDALFTRGRGKYVFEVDFKDLIFAATETSLKIGMKRLDKIIRRQIAVREQRTEILNRQLKLSASLLEDIGNPMHPECTTRDGKLSEWGVEVCYRLFDSGREPMAVAHLMGMTLRSTTLRFKQWKKAGEQKRIRKDRSTAKKRYYSKKQ
jgi:uncharacterized protein YutE (UPF0331/DUF86 family)